MSCQKETDTLLVCSRDESCRITKTNPKCDMIAIQCLSDLIQINKMIRVLKHSKWWSNFVVRCMHKLFMESGEIDQVYGNSWCSLPITVDCGTDWTVNKTLSLKLAFDWF